MTKKELSIFAVVGLIFAFMIAILRVLQIIDPSASIQLTISFILVLVTAVYVTRTREIPKAAREQADASITMAKETKEQRYSESLPLLVPTITPDADTRGLDHNEVPYWILCDGTGLGVT